MKKTRHILWILFCIPLLVAGAVYIAGDFLNADLACWSDATDQTLFIVTTVMILFTLAIIPLALRLFRFRRVHDQLLTYKAQALMKWGSLRLLMLGILLVANTLLYYAFAFQSSFGYLAAITLLVFPFVLPTRNRCLAETEPASKPEPETEPEQETDPESETERKSVQ